MIAKALLEEVGLCNEQNWETDYFCHLFADDFHEQQLKTDTLHEYIIALKKNSQNRATKTLNTILLSIFGLTGC